MTVNVKGWRRALLGAATAAALMGLASCGGGEQVEAFVAKRVFAFGDETSVINSDGSKYSINALATSSTYDCSSNPLWIQSVAAIYGLVFPQCNPNGVTTPDSRIYAANGAKVADLSAQIDQQVLSGGFADGDLATVLIGANDIIAQYQQYPSIGEDQLDDNLTQAANALGDQINRLADLGVKVIVATVPDMGLTPYAGDPSGSNAALLSRLSAQFNIKMRTRIYNDGHRIGLVLLDEYLQTVRKFGLGFVNTTDAACLTSAPLPTCTTSTLTTDSSGTAASASTWVWADNLHLSPGAQSSLGSLAVTRAQNNPF